MRLTAIFHHEPCPLHESQNKSSLCQQKSPGLLLSTEAKAYDAHEQRLVINAGEAEIIQKIFNRYIETNSLKAIFDELNTQGHKTKSFVSKRKKVHQGREFSKNTVYNILKNPVYVGQIKHKEEIYQGKHQAIISQELWDRVQNQMRDKNAKKQRVRTTGNTSLLKGLLFDYEGNAMSPSFSKKKGKIYRYYLSQKALKRGYERCQIKNIPCEEIESIVLRQIKRLLMSPEVLTKTFSQVMKDYPQLKENELRVLLEDFNAVWAELFPAEQRKIIELLINKITVHLDKVEIEFLPFGIIDLAKRLGYKEQLLKTSKEYKPNTIEIPYNFQTKKGYKFMVTPDEFNIDDARPKFDSSMIKAITRGFEWQEMLDKGKFKSITELSEKEGMERTYLSKLLRLRFLSPDIIDAILTGKQPKALCLTNLFNLETSIWNEQKEALGF